MEKGTRAPGTSTLNMVTYRAHSIERKGTKRENMQRRKHKGFFPWVVGKQSPFWL